MWSVLRRWTVEIASARWYPVAGFVVALTAMWLSLPAPSHAEEPEALGIPGLNLAIGAGVVIAPTFAGSKGQKISPAPYINGSYRDWVDFDFFDGVRVNALHSGDFTLGPAARYRYGRSPNDAARELHGLGTIDDSLELGGFIGFDHGPFSAELLILQDVTGDNSGLLAEARASISIPIGRGGFEIGPFVRFADQKYMQTFYGIDAKQAASSGRPYFSPSSGIDSAGLEFEAVLPISDKFSIRGRVDYDRLVGDAARSPFVQQDGAQDQFYIGLFLVYTP